MVNVAVLSPTLAVAMVGAAGGAIGVTDTAFDSMLSPLAFIAFIFTGYDSPFVRLDIVMGLDVDVGLSGVQLVPLFLEY